jgi:hypothetical protein
MDNLWGNFNTQDDQETPKQILEEQAKKLKSLTNGAVYATVESYFPEINYSTTTKFGFEFVIKSMYFEKYRYLVFSIEHDAHYYPLTIVLNENIERELFANELQQESRTCSNKATFISLLAGVLKSKEVLSVIGALFKLSK